MNLLICKICKEKFQSRFSNKNACSSECNRVYRNIQRNNLKNKKRCKYCKTAFLGNSATLLCASCKDTRKVVNKKIEVTYLCPKCREVSYIDLAKTGKKRMFISKTLCKECKKKIQYNKNSYARIHSIRTRLYKAWIFPIMERDGFTCRKCSKTGNELEVHHNKEPFSEILKKFTKGISISSFNYKDYIKISDKIIKYHKKVSGITLCTECHSKVDLHRKIKRDKI